MSVCSSNVKGLKFMERSCSERDLSSLSHSSNRKRNQSVNESRSEAQLFNNTLLDVNNTPREYRVLCLVSVTYAIFVGNESIFQCREIC